MANREPNMPTNAPTTRSSSPVRIASWGVTYSWRVPRTVSLPTKEAMVSRTK